MDAPTPRTRVKRLGKRAHYDADTVHGILDATPICGLGQSASVMPTARNMPRAAARSKPSVTSLLRGFMSVMGSA